MTQEHIPPRIKAPIDDRLTASDLKEALIGVPDHWIIVVEKPDGTRTPAKGVRGDAEKRELMIEL